MVTPENEEGMVPPKKAREESGERIRVSLIVYIISLVLVALIVFIIMLVQYLPGHRAHYRLSQVVKNSNVELNVNIPMAEVRNRDENPFTLKQEQSVIRIFKDMGVKGVRVKIYTESEKK